MLRSLSSRSELAGFTLAELLIAITILSVLVSLGMPSFFKMLRNAEVRAAAESIANGMQRARAEAVSRNARVHFVLSGVGSSSWTVDLVTGAGATPIDSRQDKEGSPNAATTPYPETGGVKATKITFGPLGQIVTNIESPAAGSDPINRVEVKASGGLTLEVRVGSGGAVRVCDPAATAPNPRAC